MPEQENKELVSAATPAILGAVDHTITVVYGLPKQEKIVGGRVVVLSHQAGMELSGATTDIFRSRGHRIEVIRTNRLLMQRPDPNLIGVYLENDEVFAYSREVTDLRTGRGSGRFETTIYTTREEITELNQLRVVAGNQDLPKAA